MTTIHKSPFTLSAISLLATLLFSCHKHEALQTESTYTFANQTGRQITFDIYNSREDYYLNANRMQQYFIEPGASQKIVFEALRTFWIDWYSTDYSVNNWQSEAGNRGAYPPPEVKIANVDDSYFIRSFGPNDTTRSVLLNGGGISSTWQGIYANSGSALDGTYRFTFRKDLTGEYTFTNTSGAAGVQPFNYSGSGSSFTSSTQLSFRLSITSAGFQQIFDIDCNLGQFTVPHTGRDTMRVSFVQNMGPSFAIVRQ